MPFDGRLYNPEQNDAETVAGSPREPARSRAPDAREHRPEPLAPSDLTSALLAEIDSPELAEMASLLVRQADDLERHYPSAAPLAVPEYRLPSPASNGPRRARILLAAVVLLSASVGLGGWMSGRLFVSSDAAALAPAVDATQTAKSIAPASRETTPGVAPLPGEAVVQTARREGPATDSPLGGLSLHETTPGRANDALLDSLMELDGSAREGLIDLEESGDVPPGRFSL